MAFGPGLTVETGLFTKLRQLTGGPANPARLDNAGEEALLQDSRATEATLA
jgi:hypothetical protein